MKSKKPSTKSEYTKTFHWFFCDIVSSAHPSVPTQEQILKIQKFYEILSTTKIMKKKDSNRIVVPTGDGYVIGFSDSLEKPVLLALDLLKEVKKYNKTKGLKEKLLLRVGIDSGPVYVIKDLVTGKNAFWGPGIIMTKRVMDIGKENHILASKRIAEDLMKLSREYKDLFHSIGKYEIKHGEKIEIYNVYGKNFGNRIFPRQGKETQKADTEKDRRGTNNFKFKKIDISLEIIDSKTSMTHHTWVWDLVNVSKLTQEKVLYRLGGDTKKDFSDLNIKVTDGNGNELEIVRIDKNTAVEKDFLVKLSTPCKPGRAVRGLKLEYDWEEPDKEFSFTLPTFCNLFSYNLIVPNELNPRARVFRMIGISEKESLDAKTIHGKKNTEITWSGKNLKPYDEFILQW